MRGLTILTIKRAAWAVVLIAAVVFVYLLSIFFQPLFLRQSFIDSIAGDMRLEIPQTAEIVEYRFGISSFGIDPFFAKLELSQEEFEVLFGDFEPSQSFNRSMLQSFTSMQRRFNYELIHADDIVRISWWDRMTSQQQLFFLSASTRVYEVLIIETIDGEHFLYMFYGRPKRLFY